MAQALTTSVVRQIESLFDGGSVAGLTDRQLLERFVARRDHAAETAFAALVARHGPMVLGVCRQLLGDHQHAEDAFQAVFLVLARKARSIQDPDLLGNWLYGVALRTSRKARVRQARRRKAEEDRSMRHPGSDSTVPADRSAIDREQAQTLHEEIGRLPSSFRLPVVLCYFEGLTPDEAAQRLRCPAGTVHSRLVRAREKLRRSLTHRGVVLPAAALAAALAPRFASASISSPLCEIATRAAMNFVAGQAVSHSASALVQEVLRTMLFHKLRSLTLTLLLLGVVATGAGYLAHALASNEEPRNSPAGPQTPVAAKPDDANLKPAPGRMFIVGRVLDPNGKPVPGATIAVYARSLALGRAPYLSRRTQLPIGDARADSSGRFRIDAPRTSSWHHEAFGAIALRPGHGVGWVELDPDDDQPSADIILRPEQMTHGRLFDLQGRPAPNVTLSVASIRRILPQAPAGARTRFNGIAYSFTNVNESAAWPRPMKTDLEGRFTLRGVGRDLRAVLTVHDPRFALQLIEVATDSTSASKPITAALVPAQILTGLVTFADTGKPVPHAPLDVVGSQGRVGRPAEFETDSNGRFRVNPPPADRSYRVTAFPPEGQPYLITSTRLEWPKGALEQSLDIALPRGVSIRGKVTEEGSGKPVPGAIVDFITRAERQNLIGGSLVLETASDGSFQLGAVPGPGYLFILGPSDDYVFQALGSRMVAQSQPGGQRIYSHAHTLLDLKPGSDGQEVNVVLRRGATVKGHVVGPDGQPVRDAWIFSRIIFDPRPRGRGSWDGRHHGRVRNGDFELHRFDLETEVPVFFLDPKHKLGGIANLSSKSVTGGPVTVRLEPCGAARARLVDPNGKPVAGRLRRGFLMFSMVVTPGPPRSTAKDQTGLLFADENDLTSIDTVNYENELASDAEGRITFPVLIPGATYRFLDSTTPRGTNPPVRKEFTVKPGETRDLGDLRIEKPPA